MNIHAVLHTVEHRGDHGADIERHFDVRPSETVQSLIDRCVRFADENHDWHIRLYFVQDES